ncbi:hypothetical protein BGY98DRAFT_963849 [Russula aff. rugulosa BPL654]|nr:hypothetical protein BGY98DRAFT_963849 [Russula aff. rugulosa BPL654]
MFRGARRGSSTRTLSLKRGELPCPVTLIPHHWHLPHSRQKLLLHRPMFIPATPQPARRRLGHQTYAPSFATCISPRAIRACTTLHRPGALDWCRYAVFHSKMFKKLGASGIADAERRLGGLGGPQARGALRTSSWTACAVTLLLSTPSLGHDKSTDMPVNLERQTDTWTVGV